MLDLPLCFSALGCSRSLCGSRGSLLNDHKELSSKPESSKSSPNTCEAWPNPSSKRLKSQFRWLQSLAHTEKKKKWFSCCSSYHQALTLSPCCLNCRHVPCWFFIMAFAPQLHRRKNYQVLGGVSKEKAKFSCIVCIIIMMILKKY